MQQVPQLIPSYIAPSAWWEHVPIAHWLIATLKPQTVVELGTHYGVSFFAFCQATKQFSTGSFIYAVDTWAGDEHAGQYSDEIYNQVQSHQQQHYRQVSSLLRQSFDEAATYFAEDSIDLLHIDGLHTYEAVRHDHETWLSKLRGNATILFHDINVREREFGVWELWREIQADPQFKCLEMRNGSGLGIATKAAQAPTWHEEFRNQQEFFQSSGGLYLELAIRHLSRQELEGQYANLAAEVRELKRGHATAAGTPKSCSESAQTEPPPERSLTSRSFRKLYSGASHVGHRLARKRYQLRGLIARMAGKLGLIKKKNLSQHKPSKQLRVIFISGEPHTPGHRYRVLRLAEAYAASGAKVTILKSTEIISNIQQIEDCDILSLWRIAWSADLQVAVSACKSKGGFVLFDVDDLMIRPELAKAKVIDAIRSNGFDEGKTAELFAQMQRSMLAADLCLTTTEELANQMRLYGKPVMVVANGYNEDTFASSRLAYREHQRNRPSDVVRIGYASGSLTHQKDFQSCSQAVARILQENPQCRLVLFHDDNNTRCLDIHEFPGLEAVRDQIEWRLLEPLEKLPQELARFDINIIPLETNNVFTEAKSELKFFEAALAGSCSIASPTGPFRRIISNGANGFLAATPEEWYEQLQALVSNPQLRQHFAAAALADTMFAYSPLRRSQQISRIAAYATNPSLRATIFQTIVQEEREPRPRQGPFIPEHDIIFHSDQLKKSSTTVVIPLYNYSQYIEETLNSVKLQTLANIDLVVVNDHSTDDSLRKAKRWIERNKNHFNRAIIASNKINSKLGPSRNVGFHLAETDYIFALDADNRLDRECLQSCLAAAQQSKAAFIYPTLQEFGASNGQIGSLEYTPIKLISGNYIDAMALVSKAAWQQVGGYQNIRHGWEDYDLWCRFAEAGLHAQHLAGKPMAYYRVHGKSMLRTTTDEDANKKELIRNLETLHPWLQISTPPSKDQEENGTTPAATSLLALTPLTLPLANQSQSPNPVQELNRLATLLPILRCPLSHRGLSLVGHQLHSGDNEQSETWPLLRGVPNLFPGLNEPEIRDEQHISHPLPEHLLQKIKATSGRVLNLSAGGSAEKLANVVEVEFALFRHTDIIADAHTLPFMDECFAGIISMNAFEHYHDPELVVAELMRVLKPGGWLVVQTAFLQPEHEYPWHFYNTTSEGMKRWFSAFNLDELRVSENFNPLYALSWLASECEQALHSEISARAANELRKTTFTTLVDGWRHGKLTQTELWQHFRNLPQCSQRPIAAGFELIATKPYPDQTSA